MRNKTENRYASPNRGDTKEPRTLVNSKDESEKRIMAPERNNIPDSYLKEGVRERGMLDEEYPVEALEKRRDCACECVIF